MRVLHLTRDFPPRINGGLSTAVGGMVRASSGAGIDCAVISFDGWRPRRRGPAREPAREMEAESARVLRVSAPAHLPAARDFARTAWPDLVHVHADLLWELAAELRTELGVPAVLTVHVLQAEQNRLRGIGPTRSSRAQERALAEADLVLAPSDRVAGILRERDPALAQRLTLARLGIHDRADAGPADPPARAGGPLLYVGRFADINGTAELLAAIPRILEREPAARFAVAGGLPENPKAERRWRRRFAALPVDVDRVELTGWLAPAELARRYARASVVLVPSWFETFGLVVLEAMLHGAPIAASRAGAVPELVTDGDSALLYPPGDPAALADAALRVRADRALAERLGRRAAERARARFTWERVLPELVDAYRRALAR